jgi:hypothetical protein
LILAGRYYNSFHNFVVGRCLRYEINVPQLNGRASTFWWGASGSSPDGSIILRESESMYFIMTIDVESHSIALNRDDPSTVRQVHNEGLPPLLDLL